MAKRKRSSNSSKCPEPVNSMIDLLGAAAMGAFTKHTIKKAYKRGQSEDAIKAATIVNGANAFKSGGDGLIGLGGLFGVNSAIRDIERQRAAASNNISSFVSTQRSSESANTVRKDLWRDYCEDGAAYGLDPEQFDSPDSYEEALKEKKEKKYSLEAMRETTENPVSAETMDSEEIKQRIKLMLEGAEIIWPVATEKIKEQVFPQSTFLQAIKYELSELAIIVSLICSKGIPYITLNEYIETDLSDDELEQIYDHYSVEENIGQYLCVTPKCLNIWSLYELAGSNLAEESATVLSKEYFNVIKLVANVVLFENSPLEEAVHQRVVGAFQPFFNRIDRRIEKTTERIQKLEKKDQPKAVRKYLWRDYCEDGVEFGLDPGDFETPDEYDEALRASRAKAETVIEPGQGREKPETDADMPDIGPKDRKGIWRKYCSDGTPFGIDPEDYDNADDYEEAIRLARE